MGQLYRRGQCGSRKMGKDLTHSDTYAELGKPVSSPVSQAGIS